MSVLIVGSVGIDDIATEDAKRENVLGGSASYASVAASFFCPVQMVGIVGDDFPSAFRQLLQSRKIDLTGLEVVPGKTFRWSGIYEKDMNSRRTLKVELNVFEKFDPKLPAIYQDSKFILLANISPELQLSVLQQTHAPGFVIADTMDLWIEIAQQKLLELLSRIHLLILNDSEARQFSGQQNLIKAADWLRRKGPKYVVIKKGEHGAMLVGPEGYFLAPAIPLERVVDPTGAGDTFVGGLAGYLASAGDTSFDSIKRGVVEGTILASFTVQDFSLNRLIGLTQPERDDRRNLIRRITMY